MNCTLDESSASIYVQENLIPFFQILLRIWKIMSTTGKPHLWRNNKQLLDKAEHDIKNYSNPGQCYLPNPIIDAMRKPNPIIVLLYI